MDLPARKGKLTALPPNISEALSLAPKEVYKARDYLLVYDDQSEIAIARDTYFKLFQKKAGRMKLENILKKIAEAQADASSDTPADASSDTSADNSSVKPEDDPEATQDVYPDDLEPDENEYSKYIHEGVEYLHDTSTDQLIGSDNLPWANIENDGSVTFLSQEFIDLHQADGDYEAPDCDDDTEIEDNDC